MGSQREIPSKYDTGLPSSSLPKQQLLLTILDQHDVAWPSKLDVDHIRKIWPGPEPPTKRAVEEQLKKIRAEVSKGCKITPGTNTTNTLNGYQGTPKTPRIKSATPASSGTKRAAITLDGTPSKKPKVTKRKGKDTESEADLTIDSSDEARDETGDEADAEDTPLSAIPKVTERRQLPARSKSRSKSYAIDDGSSGEDAGARDADSDVDAAFDPESEKLSAADREKGRAALASLLSGLSDMPAANQVTVDGVAGEGEGRDMDVEMGEKLADEVANDQEEEGEVKRESDEETERTFNTAKE